MARCAADRQVVVECLNCGMHRDVPASECPRCSYIGWAWVADLDETIRQVLREHPVRSRRLQLV